MPQKIWLKRGKKENLPMLDAGEPAFTTDTKEFYIGSSEGNIQYAKHSLVADYPDFKETTNNSIKSLDNGLKITKSPLPITPPLPTFNKTSGSVVDIMFYVADSANMQGITYYDGYVYVGFDVGGGKGKIIKYTSRGSKIKESPKLPIGHTADLSYRVKDEYIYVANGGGANPTHIYAVDMESDTPVVVKDINLESLGNAGLVAINNIGDYMVVHTASSDTGDPLFSFCDYSGNVFSQFTIPNQGVPQGLECYDNLLYYYTNNKITILTLDGEIVDSVFINKFGESEGIAIAGDYSSPYIIVGYNTPNRIYAIRSYENEKFHNLKLINGVNIENSNVSLIPRMLSFPVRKTAGEWDIAPWHNAVSVANIIEDVEVDATKVTFPLKFTFTSLSFFGCEESYQLALTGIRPIISIPWEGDSVEIRFIKDGAYVDPTSIPDDMSITVLVVGGVRIQV